MTEDKLRALLEKIRKLKAKAEDQSTTEAESLAFAAKVAELLAQHGLEEAQLDVKDQESILHEDETIKSWNASPARRVLVGCVCRLFMVRVLRFNSGRWVLIGRKANIAQSRDMTDYLIATVLRLGKEYAKAHPGANSVDFKRGCFMRISERIEELRRRQSDAEKPQFNDRGNPGNLPALYRNEQALTKAYMDERWRSGKARAARIRQGVDAMAGRAAGDRVSLSRQLGGNARSNYMLPSK